MGVEVDTVILPVPIVLTYEPTPCVKQKYETCLDFLKWNWELGGPFVGSGDWLKDASTSGRREDAPLLTVSRNRATLWKTPGVARYNINPPLHLRRRGNETWSPFSGSAPSRLYTTQIWVDHPPTKC